MFRELGMHLIIEMWDVTNETILYDHNRLLVMMSEAAKRSKSKILKIESHIFSPQGFSCIVIVEESHLSLHTWPESKYAAIDIYTCGDHTDPGAAFDYVYSILAPRHYTKTYIKRGFIQTESE